MCASWRKELHLNTLNCVNNMLHMLPAARCQLPVASSLNTCHRDTCPDICKCEYVAHSLTHTLAHTPRPVTCVSCRRPLLWRCSFDRRFIYGISVWLSFIFSFCWFSLFCCCVAFINFPHSCCALFGLAVACSGLLLACWRIL